jgi:hypothetical protein
MTPITVFCRRRAKYTPWKAKIADPQQRSMSQFRSPVADAEAQEIPESEAIHPPKA